MSFVAVYTRTEVIYILIRNVHCTGSFLLLERSSEFYILSHNFHNHKAIFSNCLFFHLPQKVSPEAAA